MDAINGGLPGAIGLQLGDPSRRVVALVGDGAVHYSVSGLWTSAVSYGRGSHEAGAAANPG
jgi:thiamine pyrophosphate-dependent acetolactate synthase large subunit-like protein